MPRIFSIGYGNRDVQETLRLVLLNNCRFLIDIRSNPYSRFQPDYNKESLEVACSKANIRYVFMGDLLGGRPKSQHCYDDQGRVDYARLASEGYFQDGLERLERALAKDLNVVLLCSELRPEQCHRSKLIGQALLPRGIDVFHIDTDGTVLGQVSVIRRITGDQPELFGTPPTVSRSRGSYRKALPND